MIPTPSILPPSHRSPASNPLWRFAGLAFVAIGLTLNANPEERPGPAATPELRVSRVKTKEGKDGPIMLENALVRILVDPLAGGCITDIRTTENIQAMPTTFYWYPAHVSHGNLFQETVVTASGPVDLAALVFRVDQMERQPDQAILKLSADAGAILPGLRIEKSIVLRDGESSFSVKQQFLNNGTKPLAARWGTRSSDGPERWSNHMDLRLYGGGAGKAAEIQGNYRDPKPREQTFTESAPWFALMNSYGRAVAARLEGSAEPFEVTLSTRVDPNDKVTCALWAQVTARTRERSIPPGGSAAFSWKVLVGDAVAGCETLLTEGVLVGADVPPLRPSGVEFPVFATVVSKRAQNLTVTIQQRAKTGTGWQVLGKQALQTQPGVAVYARVPACLDKAGEYVIATTFMDGAKQIAVVERPIVIGDTQTVPSAMTPAAKLWAARMPAHRVEGNWKEIGRQMVRIRRASVDEKAIRAKAATWDKEPEDQKKRARDQLEFMRGYLPWYVQYQEGVAEESGLPVEVLVSADLPDAAVPSSPACIAFAILNSPDGPMAALSNEGYYAPESRCYYLHVKPAEGYAFHTTDGCGINEKGLAICSTNLDERADDAAKGEQEAREWIRSGKHLAPFRSGDRGNIVWLLARCATVEEAVAYLMNPATPVSTRTNMVMVDRQGNAAVFQASGLGRVIRRPLNGILTCSNYPAAALDDGRFTNPGNGRLYYNAVQRGKKLAGEIAAGAGTMRVRDAQWLLANRQEPGPICQTGYNNPARFITTTSFLAQCKTGDLYLCWGDPWTTQFVRYPLLAPVSPVGNNTKESP